MSIIQSVYSSGDITEFTIGKANQSVGNHSYLGGFSEMHREVFYLNTPFEGGRHEKRIAKLMAIETR